MSVLVDTCIWSLALRRTSNHSLSHVNELKELIMNNQARIIGAIRQEILSGIKLQEKFILLRQDLKAFSDIALQVADYEYAAELFNLLQSKGIQGSNTDFLICSAAIRYNMKIFTVDKDFQLFAKHIPIKLYSV